MPEPRCRADEFLKRGGPIVNVAAGTGIAVFAAGPHLLCGPWSDGVASTAGLVLALCCCGVWWVRNTELTVAQWLLAVGLGPLVRGRWNRTD